MGGHVSKLCVWFFISDCPRKRVVCQTNAKKLWPVRTSRWIIECHSIQDGSFFYVWVPLGWYKTKDQREFFAIEQRPPECMSLGVESTTKVHQRLTTLRHATGRCYFPLVFGPLGDIQPLGRNILVVCYVAGQKSIHHLLCYLTPRERFTIVGLLPQMKEKENKYSDTEEMKIRGAVSTLFRACRCLVKIHSMHVAWHGGCGGCLIIQQHCFHKLWTGALLVILKTSSLYYDTKYSRL